MSLHNRFTMLKNQLAQMPIEKQKEVHNATMKQMIPIFGTLSLLIDEWEYDNCILSLENQISVQNGWGSIQAGGIYTLAESAMALVIGANLKDDQIIVAKSVNIHYLKKSNGNIQAKAKLTTEQIKHIRENEKGELHLQSEVFDSQATHCCSCEGYWVWHSLKK